MATNTYTLFGLSLILGLVAFSTPSFACTTAGTDVCPSFVCNSTVGVAGRIYTSVTRNLVASFVLDPRYSSPITTDTQCKELCQQYVTCTYWTHLQTGPSGACNLYKSAVCNGTSLYESASICTTSQTTVQSSGSICSTVTPFSGVGVVGDPHYTGADNSHFDFTGLPGKSYCMLSDSHLHINVFHVGRFDRWGDNPSKPLTWIRKLVIFWGQHQIFLAAREGAQWEYGNGYMQEITVDGKAVSLPNPKDSLKLINNKVEISWVAARKHSGDDEVDVYEVKIEGVAKLVLTLRPEIALLRTATDGVVHFSMDIPEVEVSPSVHGILGQTFRPDHNDRIKKQHLVHSDLLKVDVVPGDNAEGFLDGKANDYETTDLFQTDCAVSRFQMEHKNVGDKVKSVSQTSMTSVYRSTLPRKMAIDTAK